MNPPPPYRIGFTTLEDQVRVDRVPVQGNIPAWLTGTLLRNGPAKFEVGKQRYRHWFDGLAMLHKFSFQGNHVSYANRFLESQTFLEAREQGKISRGEFGTDPCRSLFGRVMTWFRPRTTDNAAVSINLIANEFVALTESPLPIIFDPDTLRTRGPLAYETAPSGQLSTAHPHIDFSRDRTFVYRTQLARRSAYQIFSVPADNKRAQLLGSVAVDKPAYLHSFGMTERYLILAEGSLVVSPLALRLSGKPFIENFQWQPERGTRFHIIGKDTGRLVTTCEGEALFTFHHVNAFEEGDEIVVDLVAYPDATIIDALFLDRLRTDAEIPGSQLRRYRLPLTGGNASQEILLDATIELPRINYRMCNTHPYRYLYGTGVRRPGWFFDQLVKVDLQERRPKTWFDADCYPGEPIFVAAPAAQVEDAGVILSVVLDANKGESFLLVLDARSFEELARAAVPHPIPFGLHGQYFESTEDGDRSRHLHR